MLVKVLTMVVAELTSEEQKMSGRIETIQTIALLRLARRFPEIPGDLFIRFQ